MRIGILTLPLHTNYGGILQAYALQTALQRMGHEVEVIIAPVEPTHLPIWRKTLSIAKRILQHYLLGRKDIAIDRVKEERRELQTASVNTEVFIQRHINVRRVKSLKEIKQNDYDAIVVGSDQIWRSEYNHKWKNQKEDDVYLGFTKGWNIKRIAYAASFGINKIEIRNEDIESCRKAISKFDAVSTRETSGVEICNKKLGVNAVCMPDPTMILLKEDYEKFIPSLAQNNEKHQLLSYILDDNKEKTSLRERISKEKNLIINITNKCDYNIKGKKFEPQPPVEDWLKAFAESDYVITDSFHACVFSIIFHKQFTVIANKDRGLDRFTSLLKTYGLMDRMVYTPSEYHSLHDIDYNKVDALLRGKRQEAISFLKSYLN